MVVARILRYNNWLSPGEGGSGRGLLSFQQLFFLCVAILAAMFFAACEEIEEEKPWIQVERPEMLFTDTTLLDSYEKGVLAWKLKTAYLERWGEKDFIYVRPILVDVYDSLGERTAFLRADSARMDMKFSYVNAYGHVYALTPKGASVRADSLIWNKKENLVRTESSVRVVTEDGDVLQGKGFVSDAKMDNWRILANVSGIFQDAANRLKEEDKKQAVELEQKDKDLAKAAAPGNVAPRNVAPNPPKPQTPKAEKNKAKEKTSEDVEKEEDMKRVNALKARAMKLNAALKEKK